MRPVLGALAAMGLGVLASCATARPAKDASRDPAEASRPSVSATSFVTFLGKTYVSRFEATDQAVPAYGYFLEGETPQSWTERVDFRVYPVVAGGNSPSNHAARAVSALKRASPQAQFAMYENPKTETALLDFLTWPPQGADDMEFNAFKFFKDGGTDRVMSVRYARKVPVGGRDIPVISAEVRTMRSEVVPALAHFPLYRQ